MVENIGLVFSAAESAELERVNAVHRSLARQAMERCHWRRIPAVKLLCKEHGDLLGMRGWNRACGEVVSEDASDVAAALAGLEEPGIEKFLVDEGWPVMRIVEVMTTGSLLRLWPPSAA